MKELLTWQFPWLIFRSIFLLADGRGSSYVDVDFPMQVDFIVAFEGTEMLADFLDGVTDQSKEISNRKRLFLLIYVYERDFI